MSAVTVWGVGTCSWQRLHTDRSMNNYYYLSRFQAIQQNRPIFQRNLRRYIKSSRKKNNIFIDETSLHFFSFTMLLIASIPYKHFCSSLIKEFRAATMEDVQIIILNSEYQTLKQAERNCAALKEKNKQLKDDLWGIEQQLKKRDEAISLSNKTIKELSKNALNLSKKIMVTEGLLVSQEEKWLLRQKQLLQKNMNCLRVKEQIEEGWKRQKHALQIKNQQYKEMVLRLNSLEQKLTNELSNNKDYESKLNTLEEQLTKELSLKQQLQVEISKALSKSKEKEEQLQLYIEEDTRQKNQYKLQIEKIGVNEEELKLLIAQKDAVIDKMEIELHITAQRLKQSEDIIKSLQQQLTKNRETISTLQSKLQNEKFKAQCIESQLQQLIQERESEQKEWNLCKRKFRDKITKVFEQLSLVRDQIHKFNLSHDKIFGEVLQLCEKRVCTIILQMSHQSSKKIEKISFALKQENRLLKEAFQSQRYQLNSKHKRLIEQKEVLKLTIHEAQKNKSLLYNNEQYSSGKLKKMKNQLQLEVELRKKCQEESVFLKKEVQNLQENIVLLEKRLKEQAREHISSQMNTEVINIQEQVLYGKKRDSKVKDFRAVIEQFWAPLNQYLKKKTTELKTDPQLKEMTGEIIKQEFEIILKRFGHLFLKNGYDKK